MGKNSWKNRFWKYLLSCILFGIQITVICVDDLLLHVVSQEPQVMLECVKLLQSLSRYREHLRDLPRKNLVDILSEVITNVLFLL